MAKSSLAMDQHALVIPEIAELVRFDFVFLGFVVIHIAFAAAVTPRAFDDPLLAEKIRALHGVLLVGGTENHPVTEIQCKHFGFVVAERRNE